MSQVFTYFRQFLAITKILLFRLQLLFMFDPFIFPLIRHRYFRANQQLCDGAIRCATGHIFPVHRAILSAVSPYFKALFTNSLKGGKTETTEVVIDSVPGKIFSLILDYAYTGTCNVNADNVEQLLPLADQFEVLGVVQICCQFLLQELRPENCLG